MSTVVILHRAALIPTGLPRAERELTQALADGGPLTAPDVTEAARLRAWALSGVAGQSGCEIWLADDRLPSAMPQPPFVQRTLVTLEGLDGWVTPLRIALHARPDVDRVVLVHPCLERHRGITRRLISAAVLLVAPGPYGLTAGDLDRVLAVCGLDQDNVRLSPPDTD